MQEKLVIEFDEIIEKSVITKHNNCIYNRALVTWVYQNEKDIDRNLGAILIRRLTQLECRGNNELIYRALTVCKIMVFLLDRFKNDKKFVKTIINKLIELNYTIKELKQNKKIINCGKVFGNIICDCKEKIAYFFRDEEILKLGESLNI